MGRVSGTWVVVVEGWGGAAGCSAEECYIGGGDGAIAGKDQAYFLFIFVVCAS